MLRSAIAASLLSAAMLSAPVAASACAVTNRLSAEEQARDAEREGRAWAAAPLVYVAEITGVGAGYETFELTPRRVLKGGSSAPVLSVQAMPQRGVCIQYHGLSVSDGATMGDAFIVYVLSEPARTSDLHVVSVRMVGDPATQAALARTRWGR